jgi:adenosylcobinamide-GDP ribazoletransferase
MTPFFAALAFLSILPAPPRWCGGAAALERSAACFPPAGLLFGAIALLVVASMAISGGLHVDGLAGTADGFFSSRKRERVLEIVRDSRSGSMGVAAVAAAIFLMPLAGRCALVFGMTSLPYARPEGGLPNIFAASTRWHVIWSVAVLFGAGWIAAGWRGLAAALSESAPGVCAVLTGRDAPQHLIEMADTVTEMRCLKHGCQMGIAAQQGVEF